METKSCQQCNNPFTPRAINQLYCSDLCSRRAWRKRRKVSRTTASLESEYWKQFRVYDNVDNDLAQHIFSQQIEYKRTKFPSIHPCILSFFDPDSILIPSKIQLLEEFFEGKRHYVVDVIDQPDSTPIPLKDYLNAIVS